MRLQIGTKIARLHSRRDAKRYFLQSPPYKLVKLNVRLISTAIDDTKLLLNSAEFV